MASSNVSYPKRNSSGYYNIRDVADYVDSKIDQTPFLFDIEKAVPAGTTKQKNKMGYINIKFRPSPDSPYDSLMVRVNGEKIIRAPYYVNEERGFEGVSLSFPKYTDNSLFEKDKDGKYYMKEGAEPTIDQTSPFFRLGEQLDAFINAEIERNIAEGKISLGPKKKKRGDESPPPIISTPGANGNFKGLIVTDYDLVSIKLYVDPQDNVGVKTIFDATGKAKGEPKEKITMTKHTINDMMPGQTEVVLLLNISRINLHPQGFSYGAYTDVMNIRRPKGRSENPDDCDFDEEDRQHAENIDAAEVDADF